MVFDTIIVYILAFYHFVKRKKIILTVSFYNYNIHVVWCIICSLLLSFYCVVRVLKIWIQCNAELLHKKDLINSKHNSVSQLVFKHSGVVLLFATWWRHIWGFSNYAFFLDVGGIKKQKILINSFPSTTVILVSIIRLAYYVSVCVLQVLRIVLDDRPGSKTLSPVFSADFTCIPLPFSTLHCGGYQGKANGKMMVINISHIF